MGDEEAVEYFAIDPSTGTVVLKKSLVDATTSRYTVSSIPECCNIQPPVGLLNLIAKISIKKLFYQ